METRNTQKQLSFSIFKASKYLFECENVQNDREDINLSDYTNRLDEIAAMNLQQIHVMKRVGTIEVENLIKSSSLAPPQCLLSYKEEKDADAFKSFCIYLQERQRAGIATLKDDLLVAFIPIHGSDEFLHCALIQAKVASPFEVVFSEKSAYTTKISAPIKAQRIDEENFRRLREVHASFNASIHHKLEEWAQNEGKDHCTGKNSKMF